MAVNTRFVTVGLGLVGILAAAAVGFYFVKEWLTAPPDPAKFLLRDTATEVGLTFRNNFLPGEQGETFKINLYDHGSGVAVGDFDGDGFDDIYFCNQLGRNALYRNRRDGTFEDVTNSTGVAVGDRVSVGATFVDYDNDGRQDLFVTSTRGGNILFHNEGNGKFRDVTKEAGVTYVGHSQSALFFDFDGDGLLDFYLTNTAQWTTADFDRSTKAYVGKGEIGGLSKVVTSPKEKNILYRNNGNGTFADVTEKAGVAGRGWAGDAAAFDYNDDGKPDLIVTSMFGRSQLYRNNGNGTFTDVTLSVLGKTPWGGMGVRPFGAHNNGRLDLYIVDMHSDMWMGADFEHTSFELAKKYTRHKFDYFNGPRAEKDPSVVETEKVLGQQIGFKHEEVLFGNAFYRNEGGGKFQEVSDAVGLETFWPWGIATGDFDNDGNEDAFVPAGMGYPFYFWPNSLLMNQGNGTFVDRAADAGLDPPLRGGYHSEKIAGKEAARSSRSAATADFQNDGRLQIVTNNFNDQPLFLQNQFPRSNYVAFRLRGTKSNRDAIGAIVRVHQGDKVRTRLLQSASGYLSQSSKVVHVGLGELAKIDRVEIVWPSGRKQTLTGLEPNRRHDLAEPTD